MSKAFIFDMDGVLVNSEVTWEKRDREFFGEALYKKIKDDLLGSTPQAIYELARKNGFQMPKDEFLRRYDELALSVYAESELTKGADELIEKLVALGFKIGLVTSSPMSWVEQVLPRLKNRNAFSYVLSIAERNDIRSKPFPDGYIEAMSELGVGPDSTVILEDSSNGIAAAKASGAFTIHLREHLPSKTYPTGGAGISIEEMASLNEFLERTKP